MARRNISNHTLGDGLRPYKYFFNLHTFPILFGLLKPVESPYKPLPNDLHARMRSLHPTDEMAKKVTTQEIRVLMILIFATGANVSS
jgi:hypothetical protein